MHQERLWILIARKLAGETSDNNSFELNELVYENQDFYYQFEMLSHFWENASTANAKPSLTVVEKLMVKIKTDR